MSKKEKVLLRASAIDGDMTEYHFSIEFYIFREGESYIAYCPSLDISTCAETYNDAISSFYEAFQYTSNAAWKAAPCTTTLRNMGGSSRKRISPRRSSRH